MPAAGERTKADPELVKALAHMDELLFGDENGSADSKAKARREREAVEQAMRQIR